MSESQLRSDADSRTAELSLIEEAGEEDLPPASRWPRTFDAFQDKNFRWFFASLCGNFASINMQMFIRGWLVYEITGSYEKLGWMTAAGGIVGLFAAPMGGVVADRVRQKKHVIQICQSANVLIALTIGYLISIGVLAFVHLLAASVLQGLSGNSMMPSRQALTKDVVGLDRLTNAIALTTSGMNTCRLMLPGLAGGLVAALGGGNGNIEPAKWVYFLMSGLYLFSVFGMFKVHVEDRARPQVPDGPIRQELKLGFQYILRTPIIFMLLGCNFLMVFFSMTYFMLLPGFAKDVLDAGPDQLGLLISVSGLGSLAGSLFIASMPNENRARVLLSGSLILGVSLVCFAISTSYWLSMGLLIIVGLGQSARMSLSNVLIQSYVDDDYRGRVMSIYMLQMSVLAIGIYPVSIIAENIGPQWAVGGSAACLVVLSLVLFAIPAYRDLD